MILITIAIVIGAVLISMVIALPIASIQNKTISNCFDRKRKHDKLLAGELNVQNISNSELIALSRPLFTCIGMGGIGPQYNPSFTVFSLICDELAHRRELSCLTEIKEKMS